MDRDEEIIRSLYESNPEVRDLVDGLRSAFSGATEAVGNVVDLVGRLEEAVKKCGQEAYEGLNALIEDAGDFVDFSDKINKVCHPELAVTQ